jgi:hypothetical protein
MAAFEAQALGYYTVCIGKRNYNEHVLRRAMGLQYTWHIFIIIYKIDLETELCMFNTKGIGPRIHFGLYWNETHHRHTPSALDFEQANVDVFEQHHFLNKVDNTVLKHDP